jgi:hypothetical protein
MLVMPGLGPETHIFPHLECLQVLARAEGRAMTVPIALTYKTCGFP